MHVITNVSTALHFQLSKTARWSFPVGKNTQRASLTTAHTGGVLSETANAEELQRLPTTYVLHHHSPLAKMKGPSAYRNSYGQSTFLLCPISDTPELL